MSWTPPDAPAENAIANRGEATAESGEEGEEEEEQETRPAATTAANEKGTIMRGIVPSSESVFGAKYTALPQMVPSVAEPGISRVSGEPVTSSLGSPRPGQSYLETLPDDYRAAIFLHDVCGLRNPEIARLLDCSVATAKIRLHRARRRLREVLDAACAFDIDERGVLVCEPTPSGPRANAAR